MSRNSRVISITGFIFGLCFLVYGFANDSFLNFKHRKAEMYDYVVTKEGKAEVSISEEVLSVEETDRIVRRLGILEDNLDSLAVVVPEQKIIKEMEVIERTTEILQTNFSNEELAILYTQLDSLQSQINLIPPPLKVRSSSGSITMIQTLNPDVVNTGQVNIDSDLRLDGSTISTITSNLTLNSTGGTTTVDDNLSVTGDLTVDGVAYLNGSVDLDNSLSATTYVIAASDSTNKEKADYVSDGIDDQVDLNNAISALPANGGRIVLLDGNYSWFDTLTTAPTLVDNVVIKGQGNSTVITLKSDVTPFLLNEIKFSAIENLQIKVLSTQTEPAIKLLSETSGKSTQRNRIENVYIYNSNYSNSRGFYGLYLKATSFSNTSVLDNYFHNIHVEGADAGIRLENSDNAWINANNFHQIYVRRSNRGIEFVGTKSGGNTFIRVQMQTLSYTTDGFLINGSNNTFLACHVWDWANSVAPNYEWSIASDATNTFIQAPSISQSDVQDLGAGTTIISEGKSYVDYIGIGTISPAQAIDVIGNINVDDNYGYMQNGIEMLVASDSEGTISVGHYAGASLLDGGQFNTFVGYKAGETATSSDNNTFIGYVAGRLNTSGYGNTYVGSQVGSTNTTGYKNTFVGNLAGNINTMGYRNTFVGTSAGLVNTIGNHNTFLGESAGAVNVTGSNNTFLGKGAGAFNTAGNNTFLGHYTGYNNTTGTANIFLGQGAGFTISTGNYNTLVGYEAGKLATTSANSVALGYQAGYSNITGSGNVMLGYQAGHSDLGGNTLYIENSNAASSSALIYGEFDNDYLLFNATLEISGTASVSTMYVGLGTSTGDYALCHDNDGTSSSGEAIKDCDTLVQADYQEMYPVTNGIEWGDILIPDKDVFVLTNTASDKVAKLIKSDKPYQSNILGIASNPEDQGDFNTIGHNIDNKDNPHPVALSGRVMTKVNLENGSIDVGDWITTSSLEGVGMKATNSGMVVGMALESLDTLSSGSYEKIMLFVNPRWFAGDDSSSEALVDDTLYEKSIFDLNILFKNIVKKFSSVFNIVFEEGVARIRKIIAGEELCINNTCINEDQLKGFINNFNVDVTAPTVIVTPTPSLVIEPTLSPTPEVTPELTPTPSPDPVITATPTSEVTPKSSPTPEPAIEPVLIEPTSEVYSE